MSNINNNYNFYETLQPNQSGQNNTNNGSLNNTPVSMNPTPPTPVRATNNIPFNNNPAPSGKPHSKNVSDKSVKTTHMYALSPNETELASSREFACVFKKLGKLHNAKDMFADFFSSEGIGRFKKIPNVSVNFRVNDYLHRQYSSRDVRWSINEGFIRADDPYKVFDDVSPSEGKVNPAWFAAYSELA
jgi:hypothetical protein